MIFQRNYNKRLKFTNDKSKKLVSVRFYSILINYFILLEEIAALNLAKFRKAQTELGRLFIR